MGDVASCLLVHSTVYTLHYLQAVYLATFSYRYYYTEDTEPIAVQVLH